VRLARQRAAVLLDELGLSEKADEPAETLNAPERKRLELAKALSMDPTLLLLDEVMAGLNAAEIHLAVDLIRQVHAGGVTILLIEHVMQVIASLADRVIVLHHGVKLVEGAPEAVLSDELVIGAYLGSRPPKLPQQQPRTPGPDARPRHTPGRRL
jgi:branched-chain amino acid transport system ATP-binding protein